MNGAGITTIRREIERDPTLMVSHTNTEQLLFRHIDMYILFYIFICFKFIKRKKYTFIYIYICRERRTEKESKESFEE